MVIVTVVDCQLEFEVLTLGDVFGDKGANRVVADLINRPSLEDHRRYLPVSRGVEQPSTPDVGVRSPRSSLSETRVVDSTSLVMALLRVQADDQVGLPSESLDAPKNLFETGAPCRAPSRN
jgi:hypothetical protein